MNVIINKLKIWSFSIYPLNNESGGSLEIGEENLYRLKNGGAGFILEKNMLLKVYENEIGIEKDKCLIVSFEDGKNRVVYEAKPTSFYNDVRNEGQWEVELKTEHYLLITNAIKKQEKRAKKQRNKNIQKEIKEV